MLSRQCRVTENEEFSYITKTGLKRKSRCCVVYLVLSETSECFSSRAGFIVSKKVGNAVTRNLVKRRLKAIIAEFYNIYPKSSSLVFNVVIRALPFSAHCTYEEMRTAVHGFLNEFV